MSEATREGSVASTSSTKATPVRQNSKSKVAAAAGAVAAAPAQLVSSLASLTRAEKAESKRVKLSGKVNWYSDVLRFSASTLPRVWTSVLGFTIFSTVVAVAQVYYGQQWRLSNNVVPLLSVIVGLLLVFRNSTAYSRWEDGRKTFGAQIGTVRNMARFTWHNVGAAAYDSKRANPWQHPDFTEADKQEKRDALRLMVAMVVATKHHVRQEWGLGFEDFNGLIPGNLIRRLAISVADELREVDGASPTETDPLLTDSEMAFVKSAASKPSIPLPVVIAHRLSMYFAKARAKGFLDLCGPAGYNTLTTFLNQLTDEMGTVERLGSLPIPAIYGIHLKQVVSIFLFVLPFTLVSDLSWKMVPFVTVYAFILQGIEGIATEIESPFGDDPSDLPLDLLCAELRNSVEHIIAAIPETTEALR